MSKKLAKGIVIYLCILMAVSIITYIYLQFNKVYFPSPISGIEFYVIRFLEISNLFIQGTFVFAIYTVYIREKHKDLFVIGVILITLTLIRTLIYILMFDMEYTYLDILLTTLPLLGYFTFLIWDRVHAFITIGLFGVFGIQLLYFTVDAIIHSLLNIFGGGLPFMNILYEVLSVVTTIASIQVIFVVLIMKFFIDTLLLKGNQVEEVYE